MTITIEETAKNLAARLDIPIPDGESLASYRLSIARCVRIGDLKAELLRLARNNALRTRYPDGGYLPEGSQVSESSQVDEAEAQAALEGMGWIFIQDERLDSFSTTEALAVTVHKIQERRDILDPAIDKAIRNAGSHDTAAVYLALRSLALEEEQPFSGNLEKDALCYTDSNNNPKLLSKDALSKRLKRRGTKSQ